jgi:hypothetical protein
MVKVYYDRKKIEASLITKPAFLENYSRRIADNFEKIESLETSNDHLISLEAKDFYYIIDGEPINTIRVDLNGLNNSYLNENTKLLQS